MIVIDDARPVWDRPHLGLTWQDMPGMGSDFQKLNFYLFRIGKFDPRKDEQGQTKQQRAALGSAVGGGNFVSPERKLKTAWLRAQIEAERKKGVPVMAIAARAGVVQQTLFCALGKTARPFTDRMIAALETIYGEAGE